MGNGQARRRRSLDELDDIDDVNGLRSQGNEFFEDDHNNLGVVAGTQLGSSGNGNSNSSNGNPNQNPNQASSVGLGKQPVVPRLDINAKFQQGQQQERRGSTFKDTQIVNVGQANPANLAGSGAGQFNRDVNVHPGGSQTYRADLAPTNAATASHSHSRQSSMNALAMHSSRTARVSIDTRMAKEEEERRKNLGGGNSGMDGMDGEEETPVDENSKEKRKRSWLSLRRSNKARKEEEERLRYRRKQVRIAVSVLENMMRHVQVKFALFASRMALESRNAVITILPWANPSTAIQAVTNRDTSRQQSSPTASRSDAPSAAGSPSTARRLSAASNGDMAAASPPSPSTLTPLVSLASVNGWEELRTLIDLPTVLGMGGMAGTKKKKDDSGDVEEKERDRDKEREKERKKKKRFSLNRGGRDKDASPDSANSLSSCTGVGSSNNTNNSGGLSIQTSGLSEDVAGDDLLVHMMWIASHSLFLLTSLCQTYELLSSFSLCSAACCPRMEINGVPIELEEKIESENFTHYYAQQQPSSSADAEKEKEKEKEKKKAAKEDKSKSKPVCSVLAYFERTILQLSNVLHAAHLGSFVSQVLPALPFPAPPPPIASTPNASLAPPFYATEEEMKEAQRRTMFMPAPALFIAAVKSVMPLIVRCYAHVYFRHLKQFLILTLPPNPATAQIPLTNSIDSANSSHYLAAPQTPPHALNHTAGSSGPAGGNSSAENAHVLFSFFHSSFLHLCSFNSLFSLLPYESLSLIHAVEEECIAPLVDQLKGRNKQKEKEAKDKEQARKERDKKNKELQKLKDGEQDVKNIQVQLSSVQSKNEELEGKLSLLLLYISSLHRLLEENNVPYPPLPKLSQNFAQHTRNASSTTPAVTSLTAAAPGNSAVNQSASVNANESAKDDIHNELDDSFPTYDDRLESGSSSSFLPSRTLSRRGSFDFSSHPPASMVKIHWSKSKRDLLGRIAANVLPNESTNR